jgi:hypothetical protein
MGLFSKFFKAIFKPFKKWLMPKQKRTAREGFETQQYGPGIKPPIPYGINNVPAIIVDRNTTDLPGGLKHEKLHLMAIFCYGVVQQIYEVYFDDLPSTHPKFAGKFTMEFKMGETNQTPIQSAVGNFNRFDPVHSNYPGMCVGYFTFTISPDDNIFNGEPEIKVKLLGRNCRDPRFNWNPKPGTTIANPAVCLIDYMMDTVAGGSINSSRIDLPNAIIEANICDQLNLAKTRSISCGYDTSGNYSCTDGPWVEEMVPRFTLNMLVDTEKDIFENMQEIASVFRAGWPNTGGLYKFVSEREGDPVFSLNESNLISASFNEAEISDRLNRATVTYIDNRTNNIEREVVYPENGDPIYSTFLLEDNGIKLETSLQVRGITNPHEALQLAEIAVKRSRLSKTFEVVGQPICHILDAGDIVDLTWPDFGLTAKTLRVEKITYNDDATVNIILEEHENAIYPWTTFEWDDIKGGSDLGDPNNPAAPINLQYIPDSTFTTRGSITWEAASTSFVKKYQITILKDGIEVSREETVFNKYVVPNLDVGSYSVEIRCMTGLGAISDPASIGFNLIKPMPPQSITTKIGNFEATIIPVLAGVGLGTTFEFALTSTTNIVGRGASFLYATLKPATTYQIFIRTVNALGVSEWASFTITTTADTTDLIGLLGEDIAAQVLPDVVTEVTANLNVIVQEATANKLEANQVQALIDDSIALVNDSDSEDARVELVDSVLSVLDSYKNRVSIQNVSFALFQEGQIRAAQIISLNAADRAQLQQILMVESNLGDTNTALAQVSGQVNNPVTGLTAAFTTAQQAKTAANNAVESTSLIENKVNHPQTGLNAVAAIASSAKQTADNASQSTTTITNKVNNPVTGLDAVASIASSAKQTADGQVSAIAGLTTDVRNAKNDIAIANLAIESVEDELGNVSARAFLGVTTTVAGITRINGIVVNGATNTLEFRADTLRLSDTAGNVQMYWSASYASWIYNGRLIAATYQTAISGSRVEITNEAFPIWYGTGEKTWENAWFVVDKNGNIKIRNAVVQGAFISATSGIRVEINNDATYLFWAGTGQKTDANGVLWVKADGTGFIKGQFFQGQIIETKFGSVVNSDIFPTTATASNHSSAGKAVEITCNVNVNFRANENAVYPATIRVNITRNGVLIKSQDTYTNPFGGIGPYTIHQANTTVSAVDTSGTEELRNYTVTVSHLTGPTPESNLLIDATIKTFENKLG